MRTVFSKPFHNKDNHLAVCNKARLAGTEALPDGADLDGGKQNVDAAEGAGIGD